MGIESDTTSVAPPRRLFYGLAMLLLLFGIAATFLQKEYEVAVVLAGANRDAAVQHIIQDADCWMILSLVAVSLAIVSWGIATWRHEKRCWIWVFVAVLSLYVALEFIIVV